MIKEDKMKMLTMRKQWVSGKMRKSEPMDQISLLIQLRVSKLRYSKTLKRFNKLVLLLIRSHRSVISKLVFANSLIKLTQTQT